MREAECSEPMRRIKRMLADPEVRCGMGLPVINTVVLISKTVPGVPAFVAHLGFSTLRFIGAMYLEVQVRSCSKTVGDLFFAFSNRSWSRVNYTASLLFLEGSGVVLTIGGIIASVAATLQFGEVTRWIFYGMRPWGLVCLLVEIALNVIKHFTDGPLLKRMEIVRADPKRVEAFFQAFQNPTGTDEALVATAARSRIDPVTWKELEAKAQTILASDGFWWRNQRKTRLQQIFQAAIDNIRTQQQVAQANMGLTALGYPARAIVRAFPLSVIEAVVNWMVNAVYTVLMLAQKYAEAGQQETIDHA